MGCGQKAIDDDKDDWDRLKAKHELRGVPWKVYSLEAGIAEALVSKDPTLKGLLLKFDVLAAAQIERLKSAISIERAELVKAIKVTKKFA